MVFFWKILPKRFSYCFDYLITFFVLIVGFLGFQSPISHYLTFLTEKIIKQSCGLNNEKKFH